MTKKPRENRVPIMMSDDEVRAIDDWRFANRIATRSDAIRKLAETGLSVQKDAGPFIGRAHERMQDLNSIDRELNDFFEHIVREDNDREKTQQLFNDYAVSLMTHYGTARQIAWDVYKEAIDMIRETSGITEPSLTEEEMQNILDEIRREAQAGIKR